MNAPPSLALDAIRLALEAGDDALAELERRSGLGGDAFLHALARTFAYPAWDMAGLRRLVPAFDLLPFGECLERECALGRDDAGNIWFIFADPLRSDALAWAPLRINAGFTPALARREDILAWLHRLEPELKALDAVRQTARSGDQADATEELSLQRIDADASQVVQLVHSTLYDALASGASDIHLENDPEGLSIKYRIDGVLHRVAQPAGRELAEQAISRIKVMAELDIAERRVPQDGRFKVRIKHREVDLRVSIMPGAHGEDAVLRVLDRSALDDALRGITLESLGFEGRALEGIRRLAREPYGLFLVTGPTGSGKTTTLYAALTEINSGQDKIITIEDPVEYQLPGVLQIPVNEKKGLTFARGLRSILRHDPDKIMVGEIRDPETAQIAIQSALTGHLVFTTVHANNVFDVIGRFLHMGVDPYSFVSALNGILAQRLVRLTCPHCAVAETPDPARLARAGIHDAADWNFRVGTGCAHCRGSGYKGRHAIAELLRLDDELRELIVTRAPIRQIKQAAARLGVEPLRHAALDRVRRGITTLDEADRVTFAE